MTVYIRGAWLRIGLVALVFALGACIDSDSDAPADLGPNLPTWEDDPCETVPSLNQYAPLMARWKAQTDAAPFEAGRTVFTGSSSIRFWEPLQRDLRAWAPIQRGFGAAIMWNVAEYIEETAIRHDPSAVVIFAGTNDISIQLEPAVVADAYRCVVQRIANGLGDDVSIHYIAITPTPARWNTWDKADEANRLIQEIASEWGGLHFIDTTPAFLATGEPPDSSLFISDGLHLSDAGYAMWRDIIEPHLSETVEEFDYTPTTLESGTRFLIDLGPSNPEDGAPTESPDAFGRHWNSWSPIEAETIMNAGEQVGRLVETNGAVTDLRLVFASSSQFARGIRHGGLVDPDPDRLGELVISTATQDYIFTSVTGTVVAERGSLTLEGLDPAARYRLRLFASRADTTTAQTRYSVRGAGDVSVAELTTSGPGVGGDGAYDGNDRDIIVFEGLVPDRSGRLHLDFEPVQRTPGSPAYLSLLELTVE